MAQLARAGKKDSEEFKKLEIEFQHPTVIDFSEHIVQLHRLMGKFRKKNK